MYPDNSHITSNDLYFTGVLHDIKKSKTALQPIFEAFTNSLEAIKDKAHNVADFKGEIDISIYVNENISYIEFDKLTITDNGIGFNDIQYKRFNTYKDFTKGYKNLGSGRIQYAHYFNSTSFLSTYYDNDKYFERSFIISKQKTFLSRNAIVFNEYVKEVAKRETGTKVTFSNILENSTTYNSLTASTLKKSLLERYIQYFCNNIDSLPIIKIKYFIQNTLIDETIVEKGDVPTIDKKKVISLPYSKVVDTKIEKTNKEEDFIIYSYKIKEDLLKNNDLKLVSKGEIIEESNIRLESLSENDSVKGHKYLFLVGSDYIDSRDTNIRGILNIPDVESFQKNVSLFTTEEILFEDIQTAVNSTIDEMYPEIEAKKIEHANQFQELKNMFFLDDETAETINVSINDSESKILEKFYEAEAKKAAKVDAQIKESFDKLDDFDTTSPTYAQDLITEIDTLVKKIPLQNKLSLSHYVARRRIVLELFDKILTKKLTIQKTGRAFDEALIHNLLFQQQSEDSGSSDLWIINEDFIYFKGSSEKMLSKLEINGQKVFKEKFSEEEENYLLSLGENRKIKRPDVLLFPEESKCIIIEFKAPDVNASDHLTQIDFYANLIRNYTIDDIQITTFYGYLIGESIEYKDVLGRVSSYEHSYHFDYIYRPSVKVNGFDGRSNGSIYTEVLKYTSLLRRAQKRNEIFIDKLKITGISNR